MLALLCLLFPSVCILLLFFILILIVLFYFDSFVFNCLISFWDFHFCFLFWPCICFFGAFLLLFLCFCFYHFSGVLFVSFVCNHCCLLIFVFAIFHGFCLFVLIPYLSSSSPFLPSCAACSIWFPGQGSSLSLWGGSTESKHWNTRKFQATESFNLWKPSQNSPSQLPDLDPPTICRRRAKTPMLSTSKTGVQTHHSADRLLTNPQTPQNTPSDIDLHLRGKRSCLNHQKTGSCPSHQEPTQATEPISPTEMRCQKHKELLPCRL